MPHRFSNSTLPLWSDIFERVPLTISISTLDMPLGTGGKTALLLPAVVFVVFVVVVLLVAALFSATWVPVQPVSDEIAKHRNGNTSRLFFNSFILRSLAGSIV